MRLAKQQPLARSGHVSAAEGLGLRPFT